METGLPLIAGRPLRLQVIQLQDRNLAERNLPDYDLRKKECSSMDRLQFHGRTGELELLEGRLQEPARGNGDRLRPEGNICNEGASKGSSRRFRCTSCAGSPGTRRSTSSALTMCGRAASRPTAGTVRNLQASRSFVRCRKSARCSRWRRRRSFSTGCFPGAALMRR